jgi:hypothetical protein
MNRKLKSQKRQWKGNNKLRKVDKMTGCDRDKMNKGLDE